MSEDEKLQEAARIRERALHDEASYIQDALDEGIAKGIAKGRAEGRAKGRAEGRVEGALNKTRNIVFRMIDRGSDDETIIDITDINGEQLDKFKKEYISSR